MDSAMSNSTQRTAVSDAVPGGAMPSDPLTSAGLPTLPTQAGNGYDLPSMPPPLTPITDATTLPSPGQAPPASFISEQPNAGMPVKPKKKRKKRKKPTEPIPQADTLPHMPLPGDHAFPPPPGTELGPLPFPLPPAGDFSSDGAPVLPPVLGLCVLLYL